MWKSFARLTCAIALGLLWISQGTAQPIGICSRTLYRQVALQPQSYVTYTQTSGTRSYKCGRLNWRRCHATYYQQTSVLRYRARYISQSYTQTYCCTGYTGTAPNCRARTCSGLSSPSNGRVLYGTREYRSIATYTCDLGYELIGSLTRTCQSNGAWSGSAPACQRLQCPILSDPDDGTVVYTHNNAGDIAMYSCSDGYRLDGEPSRVCLHNETWTGSEPTCRILQCPTPSHPQNGNVRYNGVRTGDTARYTCVNSYRLVGTSTRVCEETENWSGSQPHCIRLHCTPLSDPQNGNVVYGLGFVGDRARYSCSTGYRMVGGSTRVCMSSERWSGSQPSCSALRCPRLSSPSNSIITLSSNFRGYKSVATYSCDLGYEINGSPSRTCQSNGAWSGSVPTCHRLQCPVLSAPQNGSVMYSHSYAGDVATYDCSYGYRLVGVATRVCQHTKSWSGVQPTCYRVQCPPLRNPSNGSVSFDEGYVDDIATYTCNSGYRLVGGATRVCLLSESWNGSQPTCSRLQCPDLTDPHNGAVTYDNGYVGDTARYSCSSGYRLDGPSTRVCKDTENWSRSQPTCSPVTCPRLSNPSNGAVQYGRREYRDVATYTCDLGYELIGSSTRTCRSSEAWSGSVPTCERLQCPVLSAPQNGSVMYSHSYAGDVATYDCSYGYRLVGVATRVCQHTESWTGSEPNCSRLSCPPLSNPQNGAVSFGEGYVDDIATYTCSSGYRLVGGTTRVCLLSESWNGSQPTCSRLQCPDLTDPHNGAVTYDNGYVGDTARYSCSSGYRLDGPSTRVCKDTENWSRSKPTCSTVTCPRLANPSNGTVQYGRREYRDVATYTCDLGYELIGSSTRTCRSSGAWSGSVPTCERLQCPVLSAPQNGSVMYSHSYAGDVATYDCSYGYRLVGVATRVCQHTESWTGSEPNCSRLSCPPLSNPQNGAVSFGEGYVDDIATYTCNSGYRLVGGTTRVCLLSESWNGSQPTCSRLQCPDLTDPHNGAVTYDNGYVGDTARYSCSSGYRLDGPSTRVCKDTENWSRSQPTCSPVTCPRLSNPSNGAVQNGRREYRDVATYTCDLGYELFGSSTRTCRSNGAWSGSVPTCQRLRCQPLEDPHDGSVSYGDGYAGATATYSCSNGFKLVGAATRVCLHTEIWSGSEPACSRIICPLLGNPQDGNVSYSDRYVGDTAMYSCFDGFRLVGVSSRICQLTERWNGTQPHCIRLLCPRLSDPLGGNVTYAEGYAGDIATYSCFHGYKLVGESTRTCLNTELWSGMEPNCSRLRCPPLSNPPNGSVLFGEVYVDDIVTYTCDSGYRLVGGTTRVCLLSESWNGSQPMCYANSNQLIQLRLIGVGDCSEWLFKISGPDEKASQVINAITTNTENLCSSGSCGLTPNHFTDSAFQCFTQNAHEATFRASLHETPQASTVELVNAISQWIDAGATITMNRVLVKVDPTCVVYITSFSDPECQKRDMGTLTSTEEKPTEQELKMELIIGGGVAMVALFTLIVTVIMCIACLCCRQKRKSQNRPFSAISPFPPAYNDNNAQGFPSEDMMEKYDLPPMYDVIDEEL